MSVLINRPTRLSNKVFKDRCNKVHNNKYNYSKVNYIRATEQISKMKKPSK